MKKSDRLKIVILGITGLLILIGTGIFIFIGQSICTMAGVGLFVIVCLGMVVVAGKKDDQTETIEEWEQGLQTALQRIEQLNQTVSEQSRRIMNTEGQLARYKRELAEATGKNEA